MSQTALKTLSSKEKRTIVLLGLPSLGLALAVTVVVTYVPTIAHQFTNSTVVAGSLIACEGLVALFLPVLAGSWSDHLHTRYGGRLPFLLTGTPIAAVSLLLIGLVHSIWQLVAFLLLFFAAYYLAYEPYRALYPDLIQDQAAGRAQSVQALWRGVGTGLALSAGGFLFAVSLWLPFLMGAILTLLSLGIFLIVLLRRGKIPKQQHRKRESSRSAFVHALALVKQQTPLRNFLIANALWELTLSSLKSFIILYLTFGLGHSRTTAAVLITVTAGVILVAAPIAGRLGDRLGTVRVATVAAIIFGAGMLIPAFTSVIWLLALVLPFTAFGGAVVLTLPYAILMPMMPKGHHGKLTGLYSTSRGLGLMFGPLLAGLTIHTLGNLLPAQGYSGMWLVCAGAMLLSAWPLSSINRSRVSN